VIASHTEIVHVSAHEKQQHSVRACHRSRRVDRPFEFTKICQTRN
jgi:hypothetical protein